MRDPNCARSVASHSHDVYSQILGQEFHSHIVPGIGRRPANWDSPVNVADVSEVAVLVSWVDQTCCGPIRRAGDTFSSSIHNYRGVIYEERHVDAVSIQCVPMTGVIKRVAWRADLGQNHKVAEPEGWYGPAMPVRSTDELPEGSDWVVELTIETSDPIPPPRSDFL